MLDFLTLRRQKPALYMSHLDGLHDGALHGWAVNVQHPAELVKVGFYHDGACIGETTAMHFREDLVRPSIGLGHGKYAFAFPVPTSIRVLREYTLSVKLDGSYEVFGSPAHIVEPFEFPTVDGVVDGIHGGTIEGWAIDNLRPQQPATVRFLHEGKQVGEAAANAFRDDLKRAYIGFGNGNYAFSFKVPPEIRALRKYTLTVQVGDKELRGSPVVAFEADDFPFRTTGPHVRDFLAHQYLHGCGIEIGALHNPCTVPDGTVVRYVDSQPTEKLTEYYSTEMHGHSIHPVDIVADGQTLEGIADASQDFVVANQVLEHLENTLLAVENMLRVVKPGGVVFLSLPDKRYSFDEARPVTPFADVARDYQAGPETSREAHYRDWIENVEKLPVADRPARLHFLKDVQHYPIHFHVWTAFEMMELFEQARRLLPYRYDVECMKANGAEVLFVLRRL